MGHEHRDLGRSGLRIGPLVLGGNVFGWTVDEARAGPILDAFADSGSNMIDTADVYSNWAPGNRGGESETILGRWLRETGRRHDVLVATKVGMETATGEKGLSRRHILASVDASLARLQTDRIDLYQAHADDPDTPLEETLRTFGDLVDDGKVSALGASNYSAGRLREAARVAAEAGVRPFAVVQPRYNLLDREGYEGELAPAVKELGLGVITYSSLASGFLSGKYRSRADVGKSVRGARAESRMGPRGDRVLGALDEISASLGTTPAAVAIAWLIGQPTVTAPIASATSVGQLSELLAGTRLTLDRSSRDRLEAASASP